MALQFTGNGSSPTLQHRITAVFDAGEGSIQNVVRAADAFAQPMSESDLIRTQSFMSRLWARRCNVRQS